MIRRPAASLRLLGLLGLLGLATVLGGCQRVDVMTGLEEPEAVDLIVLLRQNGISASKAPSGTGQDVVWSVSVSPGRASDAFLVLAENDRPRNEPRGFAEIFGKSKMIPTDTEERALFLQAQSGELERTIESMPSVIDARVHLSIPQRDRLRELVEGEKPPVPTAAVFVKHWPQDDLPAGARLDPSQIQRLVAGSVERLEPSNVTVVSKTVAPETAQPVEAGPDPMMLFYPLAAFIVLLVGLVVFLGLRNRELSRRLETSAAERTASAASAR